MPEHRSTARDGFVADWDALRESDPVADAIAGELHGSASTFG